MRPATNEELDLLGQKIGQRIGTVLYGDDSRKKLGNMNQINELARVAMLAVFDQGLYFCKASEEEGTT